jgi:hypothetical protein
VSVEKRPLEEEPQQEHLEPEHEPPPIRRQRIQYTTSPGAADPRYLPNRTRQSPSRAPDPSAIDITYVCSPRSRSALTDSDLSMLPAELICRTFQFLDVYSLCQLSLVPPPHHPHSHSASLSLSRSRSERQKCVGATVRSPLGCPRSGVPLLTHNSRRPTMETVLRRTHRYPLVHQHHHRKGSTIFLYSYLFCQRCGDCCTHRTPFASVVATTTHSTGQKEPVEKAPGGRKAIPVPVRTCIPWCRNDSRGSSGSGHSPLIAHSTGGQTVEPPTR